MKFRIIFVHLIAAVALVQCNPSSKTEKKNMQDPHSYSNPVDARVKHLTWKAKLDFDNRVIHATAIWDIETKADTDVIIFDTKDLTITGVWTDDQKPAEFKVGERDDIMGQALAVLISPSTKRVGIEYSTAPGAEALQWLTPEQTSGKKHPFLFTQSQAILARTWVPCQDSPSIRFTYQAEVEGPSDLLILMSASNPVEKNAEGRFSFKMKQPIPSYLLALTAGDLVFKPVSARSGIYAEPQVIEKARWEFADLEKMISGAEELYGAYQWERYDVVVLPPSFPFGGMENPRLTFATPTILAGDRSLTSLIAHELAHSWSGNLVTNATWNDFWLNEGFTVYFEHRIMEKLYGLDYSEMLANLALQDLHETIDDLKKDGLYSDTRLALALENRNPDDGVTDIAYNKGYFFLRSIEEEYGREKFDQFLNSYFSTNAFTSMNTDLFIAFIKNFYRERFKITLPDQLFNSWIFTEGLPAHVPQPSSDRFAAVENAIAMWKENNSAALPGSQEWSTHEWLHFLKNLPGTLTEDEMSSLDRIGKFTKSGNAEIVTLWLVHVVRNKYEQAYPRLEDFLVHTGRRKFLSPIYYELARTAEGKARAAEIYRKARPNYHFVATNTFDKLFL
jgi:leukotriene-A4 hydrolase